MGSRIVFQPSGKRGEFEEGTLLRDAGLKLGVDLGGSCGGGGRCGKCVVRVVSVRGEVSPPADFEREVLGEEGLSKGLRLGCFLRFSGDLVCEVLGEEVSKKQVVLTEGADVEVDLDPAVVDYPVEVPPPTLEDTRGDLERVLDFLG